MSKIEPVTQPEEDGWLEAASCGQLPGWTQATERRRAHMSRVAELMGTWSHALGLSDRDCKRWQAAGWLHDTLRDAEPESLRAECGSPFDALPGSYLHGPATAGRLERVGVRDDGVLNAIRYHTLGDARLDSLGLALIVADYLEPGRPGRPLWRTGLRARMPAALEEVAFEVVGDRLRGSLDRGATVRAEMVELWNRLVADARPS